MPRVRGGRVDDRLFLSVRCMADLIVEGASLVHHAEKNFPNSKAQLVTNVRGPIRSITQGLVKQDSNVLCLYRNLGETEKDGFTIAVGDHSVRKGRPLSNTYGTKVRVSASQTVVSRDVGAVLDLEMRGIGFGPVDPNGVDGHRAAELNHNPLRVLGIHVTGVMFIEIRVALPEAR